MQSPETAAPRILVNGELLSADTPILRSDDGAFAFGQALFETMAVYRGSVFALEAHLKRLSHGADRLALSVPTTDAIRNQIATLVKANQLDSVDKARLRITITPTSIVLTSSKKIGYAEAASTITVPFARNEKSALSGMKTINYGENVVAQRLATEANCDEAIFPNTRDQLCEGTWSNIFVLLDGDWLTPGLNSGCLPGVTRSILLKMKEDSLPSIAESTIPIKDLERVESAFLTSSIREVQPVASIDGRALRGLSCPVTRAFQEAYRNCVTTGG